MIKYCEQNIVKNFERPDEKHTVTLNSNFSIKN